MHRVQPERTHGQRPACVQHLRSGQPDRRALQGAVHDQTQIAVFHAALADDDVFRGGVRVAGQDVLAHAVRDGDDPLALGHDG